MGGVVIPIQNKIEVTYTPDGKKDNCWAWLDITANSYPHSASLTTPLSDLLKKGVPEPIP